MKKITTKSKRNKKGEIYLYEMGEFHISFFSMFPARFATM